MKIAIKQGERYLTAEGGGGAGQLVTCNRLKVGPWEEWTLVPADDGRVALRSSGGFYLGAVGGGGSDVHIDATQIGPWEQWRVEWGVGIIRSWDGDALRVGPGPVFRASAQRNDTLASGFYFEALVAADEQPQTPAPPSLPPPVVGELLEVHVDGIDFRDPQGRRVLPVETTNFLQFYRVAVRGEDPAPTLYPGFDMDRVTLTMKWVPEQLGWPVLHLPIGDLRRLLHDFLVWKRSTKRRAELTVLCDTRDLAIGLDEQIRILQAVHDVASDFKDVAWCEWVNEVGHGTQSTDIGRLLASVDRRGVMTCTGSSLGGGPAPEPYADYCAVHLTRQNLGKMMADGNFGEQVYNSWAEHPTPTRRPTRCNEIIGAAESDRPGSRSSDPHVFLECGRIMRSRNGGCFHADDAVYSRPLGPKQEACRAAFVQGATE